MFISAVENQSVLCLLCIFVSVLYFICVLYFLVFLLKCEFALRFSQKELCGPTVTNGDYNMIDTVMENAISHGKSPGNLVLCERF